MAEQAESLATGRIVDRFAEVAAMQT